MSTTPHMLRSAASSGVVLTALLCGGCTAAAPAGAGPPQTVAMDWNPARPRPPLARDEAPASVTVRWKDPQTAENAREIAQEACDPSNRQAVLVSQRAKGNEHVGEFACRPHPARWIGRPQTASRESSS